ncbi:hypothetical protein L4C34_05300 [Vibrio profundum]|uniref:hypothetical protein n=1 Tax=Vibrio profundum TaxID=2910247 RepID=UPI003D103718
MKLENQILFSEVSGVFNREGNEAWCQDAEQLLMKGSTETMEPWSVLLDCRQWGMAPPDSWDIANNFVRWMSQHNGVYLSIVFDKKIQVFAADDGFKDQTMVGFFFDYNEAYQMCEQKLRELDI